MAFLVSLACFCVFALLLRYDVSNCLCHTTYYHPSTYQLMSFCFNVLPCLPVVLFISLVHSFSVLLSHPFLFVSWPVLACLSISILYVECLLLLLNRWIVESHQPSLMCSMCLFFELVLLLTCVDCGLPDCLCYFHFHLFDLSCYSCYYFVWFACLLFVDWLPACFIHFPFVVWDLRLLRLGTGWLAFLCSHELLSSHIILFHTLFPSMLVDFSHHLFLFLLVCWFSIWFSSSFLKLAAIFSYYCSPMCCCCLLLCWLCWWPVHWCWWLIMMVNCLDSTSMIYKLPASDLLIILFTCFVLCVWIDMHACACLIDCCWLRTTLARTTRLTSLCLISSWAHGLAYCSHLLDLDLSLQSGISGWKKADCLAGRLTGLTGLTDGLTDWLDWLSWHTDNLTCNKCLQMTWAWHRTLWQWPLFCLDCLLLAQ